MPAVLAPPRKVDKLEWLVDIAAESDLIDGGKALSTARIDCTCPIREGIEPLSS